ncbi:hypothetical protein ONE63_009315 [Megalurothrips usitatus]|uniref:Uncharacterized protein n=1 Tax=Megalurothrips usitatus TaxID=439358 RepID=A0AAV7XRR1_9NEOP|nr:hypothetical protein ONE63_009315 [Megalurothrips usitatus]
MENNFHGSGFGPGPQSGPITIAHVVPRVPSTLSVSGVDIGVLSNSSAHALSTLTLTPGRTRDIDQDMEALRISRQDNPFLQQVLASRESLADSLEESESDDINLMNQDFPSESDPDPFTLPEIHEHMIRSPPPTSWPRSPNYKAFRFPGSDDESSQDHMTAKKSPSRVPSPRQPKSTLVLEEMARELLRSPANQDRMGSGGSGFSLLSPAPIRSLSEVRRLHSKSGDDNERLVTPEGEGNICVN